MISSRKGFLIAAAALAAGLVGGKRVMAQTQGGEASMDDALKAKVKALSDIEEIRQLIARYAQHVALGEGAKIPDLYTEHARFVTRQGAAATPNVVEGRETLRTYLGHLKLGSAVPTVTNIVIDLDGHKATGSSTVFSPRSPSGDPTQSFCGMYKDSYAFVDGRWRFSERDFTYFLPPGQ